MVAKIPGHERQHERDTIAGQEAGDVGEQREAKLHGSRRGTDGLHQQRDRAEAHEDEERSARQNDPPAGVTCGRVALRGAAR